MSRGTNLNLILLSGAAPIWLGPLALGGLPTAMLAAGPVGTIIDVMAGKIPERTLPIVADMTVGMCLRVPAVVGAMFTGTAAWGVMMGLYGVEWAVLKSIKGIKTLRKLRCAT